MENGSNDVQLSRVPGMVPRGREPHVPSGALWILIGCITSTFLPFLGVAVIAYGAREIWEAKGMRGFFLACGVGLAVCAAASLADFASGVALVSGLICALGIVWCMRDNHATVLSVSVVIMGVASLSIGIEAAIAAANGSSITEVVEEVLSIIVAGTKQTAGVGIEADMLVQQMLPLFRAIWPFVYVAAAAMDALAASVGSYLMRVRTHGAVRFPAIASFDLPLWAVGVLAASIIGLGVASSGIPGADAILTVSATALMSVRFIFAIQGFGVATAMANRFRFGCLGRFLLVFLSVQLETMFFALSIVGLIDVWANFRKLPRGGSDAKANT